MSVQVEISHGELIDKITILEIKLEQIADQDKQRNINQELSVLNNALHTSGVDVVAVASIRAELKSVNEQLWLIEDHIRDKERAQAFDAAFIQLARSVYRTNDQRAALKREINNRLGSGLVEEKSYQPY